MIFSPLKMPRASYSQNLMESQGRYNVNYSLFFHQFKNYNRYNRFHSLHNFHRFSRFLSRLPIKCPAKTAEQSEAEVHISHMHASI